MLLFCKRFYSFGLFLAPNSHITSILQTTHDSNATLANLSACITFTRKTKPGKKALFTAMWQADGRGVQQMNAKQVISTWMDVRTFIQTRQKVG